MKVYLVSWQDWDGVEPVALFRSLEAAQAHAEDMDRRAAEEKAARGKPRPKKFKAEWRQIDDTGWAYAGIQVDEMWLEP